MMKVIRVGTALWLCGIAIQACAPQPLFPSRVMQGLDPNFDIQAWRASPTAGLGRKVELGGRIIQAETTAQGVLIIAEQLPIVQHPAYGPSGLKKRPGAFEFAFLYPGSLTVGALTQGNRLIVVGTTEKPKPVMLDGAPKSELFLLAQCVHIWKTEGREIADFISGSVGGGYYPLEEETYCAKSDSGNEDRKGNRDR